jgi:hypothetical protein
VTAMFGLGLVLAVANWLIGGQWLVMLSQFALSGDDAPAFSFGSSPVWHEHLMVVYVLIALCVLVFIPVLIVAVV